MKTIAIVPSAGSGKRLGLKVKKPFIMLGDRPLAAYALEALDSCKAIDAIIIAAERPCVKYFKKLVRRFRFKKVKAIVVGGMTRQASIKNCLRKVADSFDIILIHDAARPFLDKSVIERSIRLAAKYGGCVTAVPESDTVKLVDKGLFIAKTLDRNRVYRAQTPQTFRRSLIMKAYSIRNKSGITDDAGLAEAMGKRVKILKGSYRNIKITTKEDLKLAEVLLRSPPV